MTRDYYDNMHKKCFGNKEIIDKSVQCGCFYCERIFIAEDIKENHYITEKDGRKTAQCPYCGIDSVIGDGDGTKITPELLSNMYKVFFT